MKELLRTTDMVLASFVTSLLRDAGIDATVADTHVCAIEGSIGAFPRRLLVPSDDFRESVAILNEAGLGVHLGQEAASV